MRARHRHLNARDIGADLVLDARFISQGNGTAVSSWPDRSRNGYDAEQTTAAKQPTFQTSGLAGQGAVKFDGGDVLGISSGYSNLMSGNDSFTVAVLANLSSFSSSPVAIGTEPHFFLEYGSMSSVVYYVGNREVFRTYDTGNPSLNVNQSYITNFTKTGATTGILYNNGLEQTSFTGSLKAQNVAAENLYVGGYNSAPTFAAQGYISCVLFFNANLTNSQRKRCEHAMARAYKIACN